MANFQILLDGEFEVKDIADMIGDFVGHPLVKRTDVEWESYVTTAVGVEIVIYEYGPEDYENDGDIHFDEYSIMVDFRGLRIMIGNKYDREWQRMLPLVLVGVLSSQMDLKYMVLDNLQEIICSN